MTIEDREKFSDHATVGTRNILSFDDLAPPSNMVMLSPTETRKAQAKHWRKTADLVENTEQLISLRDSIASHIWNMHGSLDAAEYN
jgi:hypothetical protein